jgi:hypothetical protein
VDAEDEEPAGGSIDVATWLAGLGASIRDDARWVRDYLSRQPTLPVLANLSMAVYPSDPDNYVEAEQRRVSNQVEWVTWLALRLKAPVSDQTIGFDPVEFEELLRRLANLYAGLNFQGGPRHRRSEETPSDRVLSYAWLYHTHVRGHAYDHQIRDLDTELFSPFSTELRRDLGCDVSDVFEILDELKAIVTRQVNDLLDNAREHRADFVRLAAERGVTGRKAQDQVARAMRASWLYASIWNAFIVTPAAFGSPAKAEAVLKTFSMRFGSGGSSLPGPLREVRERPIIGLDDGSYLCHLGPILHLAVEGRLEATLEADPSSWPRYEIHRKEVVESRAARYLAQAMPRATVHRNTRYQGSDGKEYELDVLAVLDRTVIFCECKAGRMDWIGRRIGKARDVLRAGHDQGLRALDELATRGLELTTAEGLTVNLERDLDAFLVVVTLDEPVAWATNTKDAVEAELFRNRAVPWAINLASLELIADLVDLNSHVPLFLLRRSQLVNSGKLGPTDELDLFMCYCQNGLYFSKEDLEGYNQIALSSFTGPLDDYYLFRSGIRERPAQKPEVKMGGTPRFKSLLKRIEDQENAGWLDAAVTLMQLSSSGRSDFLKALRVRKRRGSRGGFTLFAEEVMVCIFCQPSAPRPLKAAAMQYAAANFVVSPCERCVVVAFNTNYPEGSLEAWTLSDADLPSTEEAESYLATLNRRPMR